MVLFESDKKGLCGKLGKQRQQLCILIALETTRTKMNTELKNESGIVSKTRDVVQFHHFSAPEKLGNLQGMRIVLRPTFIVDLNHNRKL